MKNGSVVSTDTLLALGSFGLQALAAKTITPREL